MGFSKGNKYLGRARIVDEAGHACAGLRVAVIVRECRAEQTERTLAEGIVDPTGAVELELEPRGESALMPALELVGIVEGERRWLAAGVERVVMVDAIMVFDFGTLVVADRPFATLGTRPLHGLPSGLANLLRAMRESTKAELDAMKAELEASRAELATLQAELESSQAESARSSEEVLALRRSLELIENDKRVLEGSVSTAQSDLGALRARVSELEGPGAPVALDAVVEGIGSQLGAVETTLAATRSPYRLSRMSLDLKLVPSTSSEGTKVSFLGREDLRAISGEAVSTLELDFIPTQPVAESAAPRTISVPEFRGDTEVMARRRASGVGLSLDVLQRELPNDQASRAGQVVKQTPSPGSQVPPGSRVTLLVGKVSRQA